MCSPAASVMGVTPKIRRPRSGDGRLFAREPIAIDRDDHGPELVLVVAMPVGRVQPQERDRRREVELGLIDAVALLLALEHLGALGQQPFPVPGGESLAHRGQRRYHLGPFQGAVLGRREVVAPEGAYQLELVLLDCGGQPAEQPVRQHGHPDDDHHDREDEHARRRPLELHRSPPFTV